MGFNNENSYRPPLVFDVEAVSLVGIDAYLEPVSAPANYKDAAKIAAYQDEKRQEQIERAALDIDLARIVCIGWKGDEEILTVLGARDEAKEADILRDFWEEVSAHRELVGFNCLGYDLPLLLRRSLYLGVKPPPLSLGKYRHPGITDLMQILSYDGLVRARSLSFYCRRFGIDVDDDVTGAGIAALVAAGNWPAVLRHCEADVEKTYQLAQRVGVLNLPPVGVEPSEAVL